MVERAIGQYASKGSKPSMQKGGLVRKIVKELDLFLLCIVKCNTLSTI